MPSNPVEMLVFQDAAGDYYCLPRQAWEQARVPPDRRDEVERLLAGGQKLQTVQPKKSVKLQDLPAKGLTTDQAKGVKAGAVNPVGSFAAKPTLASAIRSNNWGAT